MGGNEPGRRPLRRWSAALLLLPLSAAYAQTESAADECRADFIALDHYLQRNDAGVVSHPGTEAEVARRREDMLNKIATVATADDCTALLQQYLKGIRKAHLQLVALPFTPSSGANGGKQGGPAPRTRELRLDRLSKKTLHLSVPSFADSQAQPLAELLKRHQRQLTRTDNLIIDLRGNGGGSDAVWEPLIALIASNPSRQYSVRFLASADNARATQKLYDEFIRNPAAGRAVVEQEIAALQNGQPGSFVATRPGDGERFYLRAYKGAPKRPSRVAVLVDGECASACEQFVLEAKQHWRVKIFGQRTAGVLDFSNMRPWTLPSGKRGLGYAISRSTRLPDYPIDNYGIAPDQLITLLEQQQGERGDYFLKEVQRTVEAHP